MHSSLRVRGKLTQMYSVSLATSISCWRTIKKVSLFVCVAKKGPRLIKRVSFNSWKKVWVFLFVEANKKITVQCCLWKYSFWIVFGSTWPEKINYDRRSCTVFLSKCVAEWSVCAAHREFLQLSGKALVQFGVITWRARLNCTWAICIWRAPNGREWDLCLRDATSERKTV